MQCLYFDQYFTKFDFQVSKCNKSALLGIMALRRAGDKALCESKMSKLSQPGIAWVTLWFCAGSYAAATTAAAADDDGRLLFTR